MLVGNTLLTFALLICFLQARLGLFSFLEHPEEPQRHRSGVEHAASVWRLAVIQWFRQTGLFCEPTSSLKEYPPQFCHMLAALFFFFFEAQSGNSELPSWCEWLPELCIAGQREETFGPDFQSHALKT